MNRKTHKAIAEAKGRTVYYLTEEEAAVIDRMRFDAQERRKPRPDKCKYLHRIGGKCLASSKRDGYCLNHWNMLQRNAQKN